MRLGAFTELEFDLARALRDRLIETFDLMDQAVLDRGTVAMLVPEEQGVYQIFHQNVLVYVGKTDAEAGLQRRLTRHADKIRHRKGLDPSLITFKAIRLYVFTVMDLETELLKSYRPAWNGKGFGSNDPGRERDTTKIKEGNFDEMYPIDIHREISLPDMNGMTADAVLTALRGAVPWKLRSQNLGGRSRKCHSDLLEAVVTLPPTPRTSWNVISAVVQQLPPGWQATALRSHVILYKEAPREYPQPLALEMSLQP